VSEHRILIYGYGNPGRQDDGLGNAFVEKMQEWSEKEGIQGIYFDSNYQLNIEDAADVIQNDLTVFVDASTEDIEDFIFTPVDASTHVTFTTHAASPGYIVHLCREIYKKTPVTYLLHIKGYEWDFKEGLSDKAKSNLEKAVESMKEKLQNPEGLINNFSSF